MEIREIDAAVITAAVKKLFMDCNYFIGADIMDALTSARERENSPVGRSVLDQIIENDLAVGIRLGFHRLQQTAALRTLFSRACARHTTKAICARV